MSNYKNRFCEVEGCKRKHLAIGYCNMHYQRVKNGKPISDPVFLRSNDISQRAMEWILIDEDSSCWIYQGSLVRGYAHMRVNGKIFSLHRLMYEYYIGEIPKKLHLDHLCETKNCVNPYHLEAVTCKENIRRAIYSKYGNDKDTCVNGHNINVHGVTYINKTGTQYRCRICRNNQHKSWYERHKND